MLRFSPLPGEIARLPARWTAGVAVGCVSALASLASAAQEPPAADAVRLVIADYRAYLADTDPVREALHRISADVARSSRGRMQLEVMRGTVPGSPAQQIEAFQRGQPGTPQIMVIAASGLADSTPSFGFFDRPYAVRDDQHVEAIVNGPAGRQMFLDLASRGMVGLAWLSNGFRQLSTSTARIDSPEDLHGLKVRTLPTPTSRATFNAWGAQPVAIPAAQVRAALASGEVQAQEGFISQMLQARLHEVQKHLWLTNHSYGAQVLAVNRAAWCSLTGEQKTWLRDAAQASARIQRDKARQQDEASLGTLKGLGMQVHALAPQVVSGLANTTSELRPPLPDGGSARQDVASATQAECDQLKASGDRPLLN